MKPSVYQAVEGTESMSHYRIQKATLHGNISIPSSKSQTLRALLFGALAHGTTTIKSPLHSPDTKSMIQALSLFGASFEESAETISIIGLDSTVVQTEEVIDAGNSGIVLRFCSALGALAKNPIVVTGDHSIRHQRPMGPLLSSLRQVGVSALSMRDDEHAPVIIHGPMKPGSLLISGEDSQPVSALIIAAAFANGPIEINVTDPGEKPWIDLTLSWLDRLQIPYERKSYDQYRLQGSCHYPGFTYTVPGDLSTAAFPIAAALITGSSLTIHNIDLTDCQGDKEVISVFKSMGALFEIDPCRKTLKVLRGPPLEGLKVDVNKFIDAIPILAVVACYAKGETLLCNGAIARQKECNRLRCTAEALQKMGADIQETENGLRIRKSSLHGAAVSSYYDHRMAMSLTIAGLHAEGTTIVSHTECIAKTFPTFLQDFNAIGAGIER